MIDKEFLNEEGGINAEKICKLPFDEYAHVVGSMTQEQYREFCLKRPIFESKTPSQAISTDLSLKEFCSKTKSVLAVDFIRKMREKHGW